MLLPMRFLPDASATLDTGTATDVGDPFDPNLVKNIRPRTQTEPILSRLATAKRGE
jgi:hypothetical protein